MPRHGHTWERGGGLLCIAVSHPRGTAWGTWRPGKGLNDGHGVDGGWCRDGRPLIVAWAGLVMVVWATARGHNTCPVCHGSRCTRYTVGHVVPGVHFGGLFGRFRTVFWYISGGGGLLHFGGGLWYILGGLWYN